MYMFSCTDLTAPPPVYPYLNTQKNPLLFEAKPSEPFLLYIHMYACDPKTFGSVLGLKKTGKGIFM